ncbi:MAG: tryptophan synthase subunit alpha [Lentisphaerae bacterium GWF2_45_14]|nr:MAG: tryptophan synthase subunit alpha [Lentisphaerae bacterium GWF2_45_14]
MSSLLEKCFSLCASEKRPALIAYITAGDPDYQRSLAVADAVIEAGADIVELGVPFSDPLADGEANQLAAQRALESGMTPWKVLDLAKEIKEKHPSVPLVLFTYLNPVAYSGGLGKYCGDAVLNGIDAILPLDLPPEEYSEYEKDIVSSGIKTVILVAPTTGEERMKSLCSNADAFIYYVCREGVTGERKEFASGVHERVELIRKYTKLPVVVGFGIASPEHVIAAAATGVDGVVVGSAIVRKVEAFAHGKGSLKEIKDFVSSLRQAL